MRALNTNKVFFSAHRVGNSAEQNDSAHAKALDLLRREGVSYRLLMGVWQGNEERSIMLESTDVRQHEQHVELALSLARLFRQDAVLEVANDGAAILHDVAGGSGTRAIGTFQEASGDLAKMQDGYTYDPATGKFYIVA